MRDGWVRAPLWSPTTAARFSRPPAPWRTAAAADAPAPDRALLRRLVGGIKDVLLTIATSSAVRDVAVTMTVDGIKALGH